VRAVLLTDAGCILELITASTSKFYLTCTFIPGFPVYVPRQLVLVVHLVTQTTRPAAALDPAVRPPKKPTVAKTLALGHCWPGLSAGLFAGLVSLCLLCSTPPCPLPRLFLSLLPFCYPLPRVSPLLLLPLPLSYSLSRSPCAPPQPLIPSSHPLRLAIPPRYVPVNPPTAVSVSSRLLDSSLRHSSFSLLCSDNWP
jgi:hypothetical protein